MHELIELKVGDDPEAWRAAGFKVDDNLITIGHVRIELIGTNAKRGIRSWGFNGLTPGDGGIDGLPTVTADGPVPIQAADHPNGCISIDHIVALSPSSERTVAAFSELGFDPRRERETDQYGMPMRQTFFKAGEVIIELIAPIDAIDDGPAKFFGLAHTVTDIDATAELLHDHLGQVKQAVQPGRRITTLRHKPLGMSVATAFMSPEPGQ